MEEIIDKTSDEDKPHEILEADTYSDTEALDTNHIKEHPDTKVDQDELNIKIENYNKIELNYKGATTVTLKYENYKMAANATWLPGYVDNADMFSENPLEHTDGHYSSKTITNYYYLSSLNYLISS